MGNEALDMRYLPWSAAYYPQDGEEANEVALNRSLRALFGRTDTLKSFTTDVERRLLTRYFSPVSADARYPAEELARMAQDAAAVRGLIEATEGQRRDFFAYLDAMHLPPWVVSDNQPGYVEVMQLRDGALGDGSFTLPHTGIELPLVEIDLK